MRACNQVLKSDKLHRIQTCNAVSFESRVLILLFSFFFLGSVQRLCNPMWRFYFSYKFFLLHEPDEADNEFRTVVIAIELISQSGDHIASLYVFAVYF